MSKAKTNTMIKRIVDTAMTVLLLFLMAYQVTGETAHEWIGMGMTVLVIVHQILNRRWYGALFKGKYNPYRAVTSILNILLLLSFALTAFCGMAMSGHAVPFLYGMAPVSFARSMHLAMSHWAFVLMGLHLGMHIPAMAAGMKLNDRARTILTVIFTFVSGVGLWLFLRNGMPDYLFFRVQFAFLDYEKAGALVLFENLLMLSFWAFAGTQAAHICRNAGRAAQRARAEEKAQKVETADKAENAEVTKVSDKAEKAEVTKISDKAEVTKISEKAGVIKNPLLPVVALMASVIIGILLTLLLSPAGGGSSFGSGGNWSAPQEKTEAEAAQGTAPQKETADAEQGAGQEKTVADAARDGAEKDEKDAASDSSDSTQTGTQKDDQADEQSPQQDKTSAENVDDDYILIQGGSFLMGSPESENWRSDDETQHEVSVSSFYMDPYETTQEEYTRLTGENPSTFTGDDLPVENISWLEAVNYANAKSADAGLTPVYEITDGGVTWDLSAGGYRLPTEAEWEYACRAGTDTPFNTQKSLSADEANFYGHYPYEIEENYFDSSDLEAQPGEYRQTTISAGSFEPNAWGLYDMHGNVNEWCWDYYGGYDPAAADDPTGPASGTRHVYRGGGWNDFAKNMRSAYRAAGQEDMHSYNLGLRLVRNADSNRSGTVSTGGSGLKTEKGGKVLIAYFSWSGNTRGIAQEIQSQTGADLFEITPVEPYSTDYNTVLMEAQEDQHKQARPELSDHVENMDDYDVILLGYPNWWASIPMPIASFLEEYDLYGKTIVPFCSHGGGRFGQSLTAIAKLAPDAVIGEGLSVHYSGGSTLPDDIAAWLDLNGIKAASGTEGN